MRIVIGSDHGAVQLKDEVKMVLKEFGDIEVTDVGTFGTTSVDYPDIAEKVCAEVVSGKAERGIVLCGTGIGISIAANKIKGIRCALCNDVYSAKMSRHHNDANVLAMGGRVLGFGPAGEIVRAWVTTEFDGGRHERRVGKIAALEEKFGEVEAHD
jgi:ribose 5-phosphate isomerase B